MELARPDPSTVETCDAGRQSAASRPPSAGPTPLFVYRYFRRTPVETLPGIERPETTLRLLPTYLSWTVIVAEGVGLGIVTRIERSGVPEGTKIPPPAPQRDPPPIALVVPGPGGATSTLAG